MQLFSGGVMSIVGVRASRRPWMAQRDDVGIGPTLLCYRQGIPQPLGHRQYVTESARIDEAFDRRGYVNYLVNYPLN